jgi:prepilin peptidase CpaA
VKLLAGLGAVLGPAALLSALFWVVLAGAVLSAGAALRGRRELAYVPAIAAGLFVYGLWPDATSRVLGL